jgi:2-keto-4-pentenoate hydratase/2-oxohepta-3-ene-1,7-dioic acid hydratase in catechol pathway
MRQGDLSHTRHPRVIDTLRQSRNHPPQQRKEGKLAVVIGKPVRNSSEAEAEDAIVGYAVLNDVTMRDFQYRTLQWLQGKTFENTTPFGPYLVTTDEWTPGPAMKTVVDGDTVQEVSTGELVFSPAALISYFSQVITLNPGDVIAAGTPGGVGHARKPQRYLRNGSVLQTSIEGLGAQRCRPGRIAEPWSRAPTRRRIRRSARACCWPGAAPPTSSASSPS